MFQKILSYREKFYSCFVYIFVFLASIFPAADKDLGWHYKYGEYFFTHHHPLLQDIYSWTISGYIWSFPSWLYDVLVYFLKNTTGYLGLIVSGAIINAAVFFIVLRSFKLSPSKLFILAIFFILIGEVGIEYGLRSQVLSLLFFALLLFLLRQTKKQIKYIFFLPVLFCFWANIHGDFPLGVGIAGIFLYSSIAIDIFTKKRFNQERFWLYTLSLFACFVFSLVNPFGFGVYIQAFYHAGNPHLKNVLEWIPIYNSCPYCHVPTFILYCIALAASIAFCMHKKYWFALPYGLTLLLLLIPTIETRRLLPIFCVVMLPFLAEVFEKIPWDLEKLHITDYLFPLIIIVTILYNFTIRYANYNLYTFSEKDYTHFAELCSPRAAEYFLTHPPKGKGLNDYDWGGYLIGKGVSTKLFVDGRMPVWETNSGYSPFGDYISMFYDGNDALFRKYNFDWVFISPDSVLAQKILSGSLGAWKLQYSDTTADYFVRIK